MMKKVEVKAWNKFDKEVLKPFAKKGDDAGMFSGYAQVFTYTQIRAIALKAFKAGIEIKEPPCQP